MPTYTYRCENCGIQFEKVQKFSDQTLNRCPECGKKSLNKVYTPVGIVFKGKGFYATDNRSPSGITYGSKNSDEKQGESAPAKENSPETKPAVDPKPAATETIASGKES
jgi:putative FmdB family regulatory protein